MTNRQLAWFGFLALAVAWPLVQDYLKKNEWRMRFKQNVRFMPDRDKLIAQEFNVTQMVNEDAGS